MADRPLRFALIVGEESGDQLGAGLIDAIRRQSPSASFVGVAGPRMQARGMPSLFPIGDVAVMGLASILLHLPRVISRVHQAVDAVVAAKPDVLVIVDSPDLAHAIARRVAKREPSLPIIDYVSPSVWAWRGYRARRMRGYVDHVLALLPFEPEVYQKLGGPQCTYVGHPLIEKLPELRPAKGERKPIGKRPVMLVLPGSRRTEISRLMRPFGEAVERIAAARPDVEVLLPAVAHLSEEIAAAAASWPRQPQLVLGESEKFAAFRHAHAALAASGTVTLELALAGVPMIVAYRVDPVARILKRFLTIHSVVLPNLVLGENPIPEYLDGDGDPDTLARSSLPLLSDTAERRAQIAALSRVGEAMLRPGASPPSDQAAEIVIEAAEHGRGRRAALQAMRPGP